MSLGVQLDRNSKRSLYQQIVEHIKNKISQGQLLPGSRLPAVRQLAKEIGVTRLTVHNAYSELQTEGWVESAVGRGTFVAENVRPAAQMANIGRQITPDGMIGDMLSISQLTGLRSLAYAYPDDALLPIKEFWEAMHRLQTQGLELMQYGSPQGDARLRVELATLLEGRNITVGPDDVMTTAGATQALSLVAQALANPGDTALVETPTYFGLMSVLQARNIQAVGVPREQSGIRLDILERIIIQHRPRFFYMVPNFHNPTGWTLPLENQRALLDLAEHYGLLLVEDDIYGQLSYLESPPLPLKAMDKCGVVIYLSSFSKDIMPGIRVGYMVAPPPLKERLPTLRGAMDMFGPPLFQRAVADYVQRKKYKSHLQRVVPVYKERRDALLNTLVEWMPSYVRWTRPEGGFTCWLTLPTDARLGDLHHAALNRGLVFSPGSVFMTQPDGEYHLRLCFGNQTPETIRDSVILLSELIRERIDRQVTPPQPALSRMPLV